MQHEHVYLIRIRAREHYTKLHTRRWLQAGALSVDFDEDSGLVHDDFCEGSVWVAEYDLNNVLYIIERDQQLLLFHVVRPTDPMFNTFLDDSERP